MPITDPRVHQAVEMACELLRIRREGRGLAIWKAARQYGVSASEVAHQLSVRSQFRRGYIAHKQDLHAVPPFSPDHSPDA